MVFRFTQQAMSDLNEIDAYLSDKSPQGLNNVILSLKATFEHIEAHPHLGRGTQSEHLRVAVEPRYKHVIPYWINGADIWVLRVYHSRRTPLDYSALSLPDELISP